ncbi:MAG: vWA domain-containing protein, partial [Caulobacterales bacterium]
MRGVVRAIFRHFALCLLVGLPLTADAQTDERPLYIIVDSSGSMEGEAPGGGTKMAAAQREVSQLPAQSGNRPVALQAFGQDASKRCESIETLVSLDAPSSREAVGTAMQTLIPTGSTPIATSLE